MAEAKRRHRADKDGAASDGRGRSPSGAQVAHGARRELAEITGLKPEGVTALEQYDDGSWKVIVELLELSRVPETDDILGSYEVEVDKDGTLLGYRRLRRYARSHVLEEHGR